MSENEYEKVLSEIRTALAGYAHDAWSGWMKYLWENSRQNKGGSVTIPKTLAEKWEGQINTSFADLPEEEQRSDYAEADKIMNILKSILMEVE